MVVVTSACTTKIHLNGDGDNHVVPSRPSSLFTSGAGRNHGTSHSNSNSIGVDSGGAVLDSASRVGLDYIVENPDYVHKLASALESKNIGVRKQVFELLSALSVYNADGYARTLQALDAFKAQIGERYRFKFLVTELQSENSSSSSGGAAALLDYKTSILAFINCLILASPDTHERIRTRCEFIGLKLIHVLNELRCRYRDNAGLIIQLDVFDEQKESDESQQLSATSAIRGLDLSSPLEVFDAILRQITGTPQEVPFLAILQHLLSIDSKEPISDLIWDAAERLVHRATLLETRDDAMRLLKAPSHAKSLQKLQQKGDGKCACNCHASKLSLPPNASANAASATAAPAPPPPPPAPPIPSGAPGPPPPPPSLPVPSRDDPSARSQQQPKNLPRLPQQLLPPAPKAKMKTINWNKIPNGQILNGAGQNLWTTFSKKQASTLIDWQELEGLFCLQNENTGAKLNNNISGGTVPGVDSSLLGAIHAKVNVKELAARNLGMPQPTLTPTKKETGSELILLDAKRSLNINIFLKQFRSSNQEIVQLILKGASQEFGAEKLRGLLKLLPTNDEVEMLNLVSNADHPRLGSAEKFLLALIQINGYRIRVEAMLLREELEVSLANIDSSIGAILTAAADIKASEQFQQVIFLILVAGNFLNSGGYAGDAAGVKLSSLQKIGDIRGNKPGISLLHFIVTQAEAKDPKLVSFVNEMPALEEASKTSIEQLKGEITSLKSKVHHLTAQLAPGDRDRDRKLPREILQQYGSFFDEARAKIAAIESYFGQVEATREDLAQFFCEEPASFKIEDCFKIILVFMNKWRDAAAENVKRRKQEQEAEARRKAREEQFRKRATQLSNEELRMGGGGFKGGGGGMTLHPDDDLFIACSPRIVRRRLGSLAGHDNMSSSSTQGSNDQLTLPSPDITPNGSIRKRRSRLSSEEDESNLMDFLRSSGGSGSGHGTPTGSAMNPHIGSPSTPRKLPGSIIDNQYGSLDRSWSRGTRRRPNLMDFVNSDRERPISPATRVAVAAEAAAAAGGKTDGSTRGADTAGARSGEQKHESPAREWRERITAWFVDLENGGGGDQQTRRPPPRRFQSRFGDSVRCDANGGLATLPEVEPNPDESTSSNTPAPNYNDAYRTPFTRTPTTPTTPSARTATNSVKPAATSTYERVYPDRRPSLVNTDVVSAMEAIEGAQSPVKEKSLWRTSSINSDKESQQPSTRSGNVGRRSLIGSLGSSTRSGADDKLTLYIPESRRTSVQAPGTGGSPSSRSPEIQESEFGTKEGFDRFASIRRSRRIKKADQQQEPSGRPTSFGRAPPGPDTPMPSRRFISKVDITDEQQSTSTSSSAAAAAPLFARTTKAGTLQRTTSSAANKGRLPRSSSAIDSKQVDVALNLHKYAGTRSGGGGTNSLVSNAIPIPNGNARTSSNINGKQASSLSTSPAGTSTSAENDEGFEESPNSLETNSDLVLQNNLNNRLRRSFRDTHAQGHEDSKSTGIGNGSAKSNGSAMFGIPLMRRKSRQENVPLDQIPPAPPAIGAARRPFNANGSANTNGIIRSGSNASASTTKSSTLSNGSTPTAAAASKGRTPRILSFMRPTASSAAKDKPEAKVVSSSKNSAGLYSNKRAFK